MTTPSSRRRWLVGLAGALALLAALLAAGLLYLDSWLTRKARAAAQELSRTAHRPVEVGGVATKLVPYLGVRVTGVRVGAAPDEGLPLLELDRIEVRAGLLGAALSGGKRLVVHAAEVQGLRLNVVRLADGTTNAERLQQALSAGAPASGESRPAEPEAPADLSFLRVEGASLAGGRIAFLDRATPGAKELAVDQIDLQVSDLAAGRPLEVVLRAAVLSGRQNLEARLRSAPLPPTLRPVPDRLSLKVEPIDLSPLAPFFPAGVGFLGGRLQADLKAALGAAAGGSGPSALSGTLAARELRFREQEGGRPLDVVLEADLEADGAAGDVRIGKLDLAIGPVGLSGKGRASGLFGQAPRIEGLEVVARNLDPGLLAAYYPPLRKQLGNRVQGPIGLSLRAAGAAERPALELTVDLTPVRLALPDQLAKAAGARAVLTARLAGGADAARVEASADLAGVDLRPGGALAKAPGDRLALSVAARLRSTGGTRTVDLDRVELALPGDALTARGRAEIAGTGGRRTVKFELAAASERLDLDRLLLPSKAEPGPPLDPGLFAGLSGSAEVKIALLRVRKADLRDVVVKLRLVEDELTVEEARLQAFGGEVVADGTRLHLARADRPLALKARLRRVEAEQVLALFSPRKVVTGRADLELDAAAARRGELAKTMAGALEGRIYDGAFQGRDLVGSVAGPLARALPLGLGQKVAEGGATPLGKELPFSVQIKDGVARLGKPLRVATSRGDIGVDAGGGVKLDGTLDLPMTVGLSPDTIAALTGGKVRPSAAIPVTLRLVGPAASPSVADLGLGPAVKAIVEQAGAGALGKALGGSLGGLGGALGGGAAAPAGAGAQKQGGAPAARPAEDAKAKALEEAKKKLEGLFR